MPNELYWVGGPWPGKLAIGPRPRGGDWLEGEIGGWSGVGMDTVLSLLTPEEEDTLDLKKEAALVREHGMSFVSLPIPDRQVPASPTELSATIDRVNTALSAGKNVLIHCRQGIGRTGLVAACMLVTKGWPPSTAIKHLTAIRGVVIPETAEQRDWIDHFAAILAGAP